jgi:hypothetical protein
MLVASSSCGDKHDSQNAVQVNVLVRKMHHVDGVEVGTPEIGS